MVESCWLMVEWLLVVRRGCYASFCCYHASILSWFLRAFVLNSTVVQEFNTCIDQTSNKIFLSLSLKTYLFF